ncbi:TerC family protein [Nostoc ellipsosporum NOK]|jgi:predicted tellurium resistance membrane protein TerC|nr:TerC family protein [Nostoc ellipsosporum NOK]
MDFPDIPNFSDPGIWLSLLTLTFLEIVLGVDNIIFISIISDKLDPAQQRKARNIGLLMAMVFRIILLLTITWIMKLKDPVLTIPFIKDEGVPLAMSWKDIILLAGGLFLVIKSTLEIHHKLEKPKQTEGAKKIYSSLSSVVFQIVLVDAVFSFDSILTAIGLVDEVFIMIVAVVISIIIMMVFAGAISRFINKNPTLQMLALSFLIVIGVMLVAEAFHQKIAKSYIYSMIAFSLVVELLNMRMRKQHDPVKLNDQGPVND